MERNIRHIPSKDISIIIQGPLYRVPHRKNSFGILHSLPSIKKNFPDSEIIISTWEGEDIPGLKADKILLNKDPGYLQAPDGTKRNFNRQLVSTLNGIKASTRDYILKTRSDIIFSSAEFTQIGKRSEDSLFIEPITISNFFIRNLLVFPYLFHLSDVIQFGFKKDMEDLWEIPLEKNEDIFFSQKTCFYGPLKYLPEQSLCTRWLSKHRINVSLNYPADISHQKLLIWDEVLTKNFIILDHINSGCNFPSHFLENHSKSLVNLNHIQKLKRNINNPISQNFRYLGIWINKHFLYNLFFLKAFIFKNLLLKNPRFLLFYRRIKSFFLKDYIV